MPKASQRSISSRRRRATSRSRSRRRPDRRRNTGHGGREVPVFFSGPAARRVLAEERAEQCVDARLLGLELGRRDEEGLGGDREELLEGLGAVRVEESLLAGLDG